MSEEFRQNGLMGVTGQQGVGKTHNNDLIAQQYILDNTRKRKLGKKVLILDAKEERAYSKYPILYPEELNRQPQKSIMRMTFKHRNGKAYSMEEKRKLFYYLLNNYKNGLLILEDFNTYALQTKNQEILGPLTTARHNQVDILFSMQNMSKITRELWENMTWYRFHRQTTSVDSQRDDVENFALLKIAEIIVNEKYRVATILRKLPDGHKEKLTEQEFKKYASFYLWVDFKANTLSGCKEKTFRDAVQKMILGDRKGLIRYCNENGLDHRIKADYNKAIKNLFIMYLHYYKKEE